MQCRMQGGPMPERQVSLGIIGTGLAVKLLHWPALERLATRFKIVSVCDINPRLAQEVACKAGLKRWTEDYRELLADQRVEAVLISLPIHLTAEVTLAAAQAGKHVLAEK